MNYRCGTQAISGASIELSRFYCRYNAGNNLAYPHNTSCQHNRRSNKAPTISRGCKTEPFSALPICLHHWLRPQPDLGGCNDADRGAELRKRSIALLVGEYGTCNGPRCRFYAPTPEKSKLRVCAATHWPRGGAQSCFAQLRPVEMAAECSATTPKLLTEAKGQAPVAPSNQQDRFWT